MKKLLLSLGVMAVLAQSALAWQPSGWVYSDYPWAYDSGSRDWYWFSTTDTQYIANMSNGQWATLPQSAMASGWVYYAGNFAFAQGNGAWHYINEADTQWVVNMRTGGWSQFGESTQGIAGSLVRVEGGTVEGITADSFYISPYEVTKGEWDAVYAWAVAHGYGFDSGALGVGCTADHPVHTVNWYDAVKWCNARSEQNGLTPVYEVGGAVYRSGQLDQVQVNASSNGYRLPMENEWIFAARGGTQSRGYFLFSGGPFLDVVGWYKDNSVGSVCNFEDGRGPWPVGLKVANELGLYDMTGNVHEWCFDLEPGSPDGYRVFRGGSWINGGFECQLNVRHNFKPQYRDNHIGIRVTRSVR